MSKFEVRGESQSLRHGNVTPSLEHHHSKWPSRKRVTDDKLSDHVETNLLVSDGLYHSHGNHVDESYYESQDKSPNWHFRGPDFNRNGTKYKHSHKNADEPPFWNLLVPAHQTRMNIGLFRKGTSALNPYLLSEIKERMHQSGGDTSKGKAVRKSEGS